MRELAGSSGFRARRLRSGISEVSMRCLSSILMFLALALLAVLFDPGRASAQARASIANGGRAPACQQLGGVWSGSSCTPARASGAPAATGLAELRAQQAQAYLDLGVAVGGLIAGLVGSRQSHYDPEVERRRQERDAEAALRRKEAEERRQEAEILRRELEAQEQADRERREAQERAERADLRRELWQRGGAGAPEPTRDRTEPPPAVADERMRLWLGHEQSGQAPAGAAGEETDRMREWQHQALLRSEDPIARHLVGAMLSLESRAGIGWKDPATAALDDLLEGVGFGVPAPARGVLEAALDHLRESVMNPLREGVGSALCAPDGNPALDTFIAGVCGGWVGRSLSPSGLHGYLSDSVVGGFRRFWDSTVPQFFGLMPLR